MAPRAVSCNVVRCHFETAFDARAIWDAEHGSRRRLPCTVPKPRPSERPIKKHFFFSVVFAGRRRGDEKKPAAKGSPFCIETHATRTARNASPEKEGAVRLSGMPGSFPSNLERNCNNTLSFFSPDFTSYAEHGGTVAVEDDTRNPTASSWHALKGGPAPPEPSPFPTSLS